MKGNKMSQDQFYTARELTSPNVRTEDDRMKETPKLELEEDKLCLIDTNMNRTAESETNQAERNCLRESGNYFEPCSAQLESLETTAQQRKDVLMQKLAQLGQNDKKLQVKIKKLVQTVQDLEEREKALIELNKTIRDELAKLQSFIDKKKAENDELGQVHDLLKKEKILNEKSQSLSDEVALLGSLKEKHHVKIEQLSEEVDQRVHRDRDEEIKNLNEDAPAAQGETRSWWRRCAEVTLKAWWCVALITVNIVVAEVVLTSGNAEFNTDCNCGPWDYVYSLLQPSCNGHYGVPRPF